MSISMESNGGVVIEWVGRTGGILISVRFRINIKVIIGIQLRIRNPIAYIASY